MEYEHWFLSRLAQILETAHKFYWLYAEWRVIFIKWKQLTLCVFSYLYIIDHTHWNSWSIVLLLYLCCTVFTLKKGTNRKIWYFKNIFIYKNSMYLHNLYWLCPSTSTFLQNPLVPHLSLSFMPFLVFVANNPEDR